MIGGDDWKVLLLKCLVLVVFLLTAFAYLTLAERKISARIQLRYGPNRVGPFGLLQPAADGLKLFFKENIAPAERDKLLYLVGPSLAGGAALLAYAVIPWGTNNFFGYDFHWDIAHVNVGLLFILGITSLGVYSLFLGGFASNSKYSLLGGLRSSAQLISYEMAVSFALIGVVILAGSLDLEQIVGAQHGLWFVVLQPLAFILYFTAAFAETNRLPFDLPEAETELVAGYHTEYSSMKFALFFMSEYISMATISALITTLFLGGWDIPWYNEPPTFLGFLLSAIAFLIKVSMLMFIFVWVRWTIPRLKYDILMRLGWKVFLPLAFVNIVLVAFFIAKRWI